MNNKPWSVKKADWQQDLQALKAIRLAVFVKEQNVPAELEWDDLDEQAHHFLALAKTGRAIGTTRLLPEGQIGRMAVLKDYRGRGIGRELLNESLRYAKKIGIKTVFLHAQVHALRFYQHAGFKPAGEEFEEAGLPHRKMICDLTGG